MFDASLLHLAVRTSLTDSTYVLLSGQGNVLLHPASTLSSTSACSLYTAARAGGPAPLSKVGQLSYSRANALKQACISQQGWLMVV